MDKDNNALSSEICHEEYTDMGDEIQEEYSEYAELRGDEALEFDSWYENIYLDIEGRYSAGEFYLLFTRPS